MIDIKSSGGPLSVPRQGQLQIPKHDRDAVAASEGATLTSYVASELSVRGNCFEILNLL
jgi:bifunctional DNA-binding transcriptional regulator/antitoxin component of YhaV-PrlF toxin-antitoxin module